jgi:hypothetical protein
MLVKFNGIESSYWNPPVAEHLVYAEDFVIEKARYEYDNVTLRLNEKVGCFNEKRIEKYYSFDYVAPPGVPLFEQLAPRFEDMSMRDYYESYRPKGTMTFIFETNKRPHCLEEIVFRPKRKLGETFGDMVDKREDWEKEIDPLPLRK